MTMMTTQTTVVSTRITKETKDILEKASVDISAVIKQHLEEIAWKIQIKEEIEELRKILEEVKPSELGFAAKTVREDRDSH